MANFSRHYFGYFNLSVFGYFCLTLTKLTDSVYHYDSKDKIFELGEKFVQRQAEKEAEHAEEKGEKSVLGDLKAKKEEVAKTPKKETVDKGAKAKGGEAL